MKTLRLSSKLIMLTGFTAFSAFAQTKVHKPLSFEEFIAETKNDDLRYNDMAHKLMAELKSAGLLHAWKAPKFREDLVSLFLNKDPKALNGQDELLITLAQLLKKEDIDFTVSFLKQLETEGLSDKILFFVNEYREDAQKENILRKLIPQIADVKIRAYLIESLTEKPQELSSESIAFLKVQLMKETGSSQKEIAWALGHHEQEFAFLKAQYEQAKDSTSKENLIEGLVQNSEGKAYLETILGHGFLSKALAWATLRPPTTKNEQSKILARLPLTDAHFKRLKKATANPDLEIALKRLGEIPQDSLFYKQAQEELFSRLKLKDQAFLAAQSISSSNRDLYKELMSKLDDIEFQEKVDANKFEHQTLIAHPSHLQVYDKIANEWATRDDSFRAFLLAAILSYETPWDKRLHLAHILSRITRFAPRHADQNIRKIIIDTIFRLEDRGLALSVNEMAPVGDEEQNSRAGFIKFALFELLKNTSQLTDPFERLRQDVKVSSKHIPSNYPIFKTFHTIDLDQYNPDAFGDGLIRFISRAIERNYSQGMPALLNLLNNPNLDNDSHSSIASAIEEAFKVRHPQAMDALLNLMARKDLDVFSHSSIASAIREAFEAQHPKAMDALLNLMARKDLRDSSHSMISVCVEEAFKTQHPQAMDALLNLMSRKDLDVFSHYSIVDVIEKALKAQHPQAREALLVFKKQKLNEETLEEIAELEKTFQDTGIKQPASVPVASSVPETSTFAPSEILLTLKNKTISPQDISKEVVHLSQNLDALAEADVAAVFENLLLSYKANRESQTPSTVNSSYQKLLSAFGTHLGSIKAEEIISKHWSKEDRAKKSADPNSVFSFEVYLENQLLERIKFVNEAR